MIRRIGRGSSFGGLRGGGAVLLAVLAFVSARHASAQCTTITSPPAQIVQPSSLPDPRYWALGFSDHIVVTENGQKLLVPVNFGFGVYSLANPGAPQLLGWLDLLQRLGPIPGDGQSYIARLGASDDGQRVLISITGPGSPFGDTLVAVPGGGLYTLSGDFNPPQLVGGIGVQTAGGRRIAYGLHGSTNRVFAADVTSLPGFQLTPSSPSPSLGNIAGGWEPRSSGAVNDLVFTSPFLVFVQGTSVTVMDASNPGAAPGSSSPNNPSITAGMPLWTVGVPSFGRPSGEQFLSLTALTDPDPASLGKKVYLLAAFQSSTNYPTGFSLVRFDSATGGATLVGTFNPPAPFSGPQAIGVPSVSLLAESTNDVSAFMWAKASAAAVGGRGILRLYSTSSRSWGAAPGSVDINLSTYPAIMNIGHAWIRKTTPTTAYVYAPTGANAFVMQLGCVPPQAPATSSFRVTNAGVELPGDGTATAFLGDTLSVQPGVAPSSLALPVSSWRVDWNHHAASESAASGYPRLTFPDSSSAGDPGGPWTFVGPCDPRAGGDVVSGAGCWSSVVGNGGAGGPDFPASPAPGSTKALSFALEACNSFTPCSNGPAVFTINWKVPTVRLKRRAILTGAAVEDGSDGRPSAAGYRWYFGSNPTAPPGEALTRDTTGTGCNGSSTCVHAFPGPGTYNVWLSVPYANGYVTPDCMSCVSPADGLKVTVADIVPSFLINGSTAAPTSTYQSAGSLRADDQSQKSGAATVTGYVYCFAPAGAACTPAQAFTPGPGAIPVPAPGSYWLFLGINYSKGGLAQPRADWSPALPGVANPKAWPVIVLAQPPRIYLTNISACGGFCPDVYAWVGDTITAAAWVGSGPDPSPPAGLNWAVTPAGAVDHPTGTGPNLSFTIASQNELTLTLNGYSSTPTRTITVLVHPPLGVSVTANPTSATAGSPIRFSAAATGGSLVYSSFAWSFSGGGTASGASVARSFSPAGSYTATCTVTDSRGSAATGTVQVQVLPDPRGFYSLPPCRLFDTRNAAGPDAAAPSLSQNAARVFSAAGRCGVPAAAKAISANVTVTAPTAPGYLTLYPGDAPAPLASTINFTTGQTRANNEILRLASDGSQTVGVLNGAAGAAHLILDVNGYFR